MALFEREVLSVAKNEPQSVDKKPQENSSNGGIKMSFNGLVTSKPQDASQSTTTVKFVPSQLRSNPHPMANFVRPTNAHVPAAPVTIESGPTLYNQATTSKASSKNDPKREEKPPPLPPIPMKTMALPSDVELLAAKKQASAAHENSYLGQVLRGEKKMKRFVRTGGGQVWEDPSLAEWDPNDFRIFCGDLGNEVSDELLAKAFRKYPSFQKAKVVRDTRTNKSKGYGFVSFKHQDDFIRACREMDGKYVGNRPIKLRKSSWKERNLEQVRKKGKEKKKLGLQF